MCNSFDYSVAYNAKSWKHICKRLIKLWYTYIRSSQGALVVKHLPANAGDIRDAHSIPGSGRSLGGGHDNRLQYSCLENPMDRGAWWAIVHGIARVRHD